MLALIAVQAASPWTAYVKTSSKISKQIQPIIYYYKVRYCYDEIQYKEKAPYLLGHTEDVEHVAVDYTKYH